MGANDVHGANLHNDAGRNATSATVNESETINEAQPLCLVRGRSETSGPGATGFGFPAAPLIERS